MDRGIAELMEDAREEDIRKAMDRGRREERMVIALRLISNGKLSVEEIAACTALTQEQVRDLGRTESDV